MEAVLSVAFGVWIVITAFVYLSLIHISEPTRRS